MNTNNEKIIPNDKNIAYHEAGHAVAAFVLGFQNVTPDIIPNEKSAGHSPYIVPQDQIPKTGLDVARSLSLAIRKEIVSKAGAVALKKVVDTYITPSSIEIDDHLTDVDIGSIKNIINDIENFKNDMEKIAEILLKWSCPAVEDIAKQLIVHKLLYPDRVGVIITDAVRVKVGD